MSRPNSSAPSRYLAPGRTRFSIRLCLAGSRGAPRGARAAAPSSASTSARPTSASRLRRNWRQARLPGAPVSTRGAGPDLTASGALLAPARAARVHAPTRGAGPDMTASVGISALPRDARVEHAVGEIHDEVHEDEGEREQQHRALQQDIVAGEDRLHHEAPEPGPREDRLGE